MLNYFLFVFDDFLELDGRLSVFMVKTAIILLNVIVTSKVGKMRGVLEKFMGIGYDSRPLSNGCNF